MKKNEVVKNIQMFKKQKVSPNRKESKRQKMSPNRKEIKKQKVSLNRKEIKKQKISSNKKDIKKQKISPNINKIKKRKMSPEEMERKREEKKLRRQKKMKIFLWRYLKFFLLMSFIITCSMILFFHFMLNAMNIRLSGDNIGIASIMTFGNVMFLSIIVTIIDGIRIKIMVERPVKRILDATDRITQGDFSVRIKRTVAPDGDNFNKIIDNLNKMTEELSGVETLRTDFISNVSHEIKTPLAVIQNYITMLQDTSLTEEERKEYIKVIQTSTLNLTELITNILKLNKLEKQQIYPEGKRYNLSEQICECLIGFENIWEEKNIAIETEIEEDVYIKADDKLMSLVWNNLFSNAFKFTAEGGTVGIKVYTKNNQREKEINETEGNNVYGTIADATYIMVTDTGCGMSSETAKHIFEKFYQGDTSHSTKGNGLGLALVKRVMDVTDGEIDVESEEGKGTTFTVLLKNQ